MADSENTILWVPDSASSVCTNPACGKAFTLFRRRHHCRRCGGLFCKDCLDWKPVQVIHPTNGMSWKKELCCIKCFQRSSRGEGGSRRNLETEATFLQPTAAVAELLRSETDSNSEQIVGFTIRPKVCSKRHLTYPLPEKDGAKSVPARTAQAFNRDRDKDRIRGRHALTPPPEIFRSFDENPNQGHSGGSGNRLEANVSSQDNVGSGANQGSRSPHTPTDTMALDRGLGHRISSSDLLHEASKEVAFRMDRSAQSTRKVVYRRSNGSHGIVNRSALELEEYLLRPQMQSDRSGGTPT